MIGIGITTYNRPDLALLCIANIKKHTTEPYELHIAVDTEFDRQGVAKRKNECFRALKDCDYIILFDDDCYPIKKGWEQSLITQSQKTNTHHFCFNKEPFYQKKGMSFINGVELESFGASGGVMLFYTKQVLKKVGAFYEGYDTYGFEHIGHSIRIFRSGLSADLFCCPSDLKEYIYSHDYEVENFFRENSSIDLKTKNALTLKNKEICNNEDNKIFIPFK
jgi:glycosyltransferase involved in cell wall biosynthesis